jgi:hypothetical protein
MNMGNKHWRNDKMTGVKEVFEEKLVQAPLYPPTIPDESL